MGRPCYTTRDGHHIPGCMGCAAMGSHHYCTCQPRSKPDEIQALQKKVGELTKTIEDMEDGSYMVRYTAPAPGEYIIECEFKGTFGGKEGGVRGQPCTAVFDDYAPRSNNSFNGELMKKTVEEDVKELSEFAQATLTAIQSPVQVLSRYLVRTRRLESHLEIER